MAPRVFLTRRLPEEAMEGVGAEFELEIGADGPSTPETILRRGAAGADALVSMLNDRIDRALLEGAPRLKLVANYAMGFNNVDIEAASELGIWVTNTPDATTEATADIAFGLMIAAARQFGESEKSLRAGHFSGWAPRAFLGTELSGSTLGIVGMGRIGQAVARRAVGFGMTTLYSSRRRLSPEAEATLNARPASFDELLARSDFISLHCPLTPETRHLIDARALAAMKPRATLVNTARGPVVDEEALAQALHRGHLAGAGIDVYEKEPSVHPLLLSAPRAVLLPHVGTSSRLARAAMAAKTWENVRRVLSGRPPLHPVNAPASVR